MTDDVPGTARSLLLYGDFNCPWSYLAERRARLLERHGVTVDWRAVEHEPRRPRRHSDTRFACLREEMGRVERALLPGEHYPYSLTGFVPDTGAALSGYAEAYGAGVADVVHPLLFEAFWVHGLDVGDPRLVRTLLMDAIRTGHSDSDCLRDWGYAVDVTGGPVTTGAWRLARAWRREWRDTGKQVVPVVYVDGGDPFIGEDAVARLGDELRARGIDAAADVPRRVTARPVVDPPDHSWVSQYGYRQLREFQALHARPLLGS
jgi:hypothetical protein